MENQKTEVQKQEMIEVTKIAIQIHFNDKSVKECIVDHELLCKVTDLIYEFESKRDIEFRKQYELEMNKAKDKFVMNKLKEEMNKQT
jgi:hypothetical protein